MVSCHSPLRCQRVGDAHLSSRLAMPRARALRERRHIWTHVSDRPRHGLRCRHAARTGRKICPRWPRLCRHALLARSLCAIGAAFAHWENYALFVRSGAFQTQEIERIKAARPGFVIIQDVALDGRDDLRFKVTHPLIYRYIQDNFSPAPIAARPEYQAYVPR